ncbi:MAG TPA: DMT family transporter [Micropepsaceae bacterium]|nr:DMT family transporter [Micropepsaceae bacterium]
MSNLNLYAITVAIWGSTWLAITFQLGVVPPSVSVVWRFALSALMLLAYAVWRRLPLGFSPRDHFWMALQGLLLFGINYVLTYLSEQYLVSGLVAVIFSLMIFLNIVEMRIFFGRPINPIGLLAAMLGVAGVGLVFWPELSRFAGARSELIGAVLALVAVTIASLGTMVATHNQRLPVVQVNGFAMMYGASFVALYAAISGDRFSFDWSLPYVASLLYLALFGSVLAFGAYLTLMRHIGADRAGYTAVAVPVVALVLSTLFESIHWQAPMILGVGLSLAGNVLMLARGRLSRIGTSAAPPR